MKDKLLGWTFGALKWALAGLIAWIIPTLVVIWNGKDHARAFILDAVDARIKIVETQHDADMRLISAKLTPMADDVKIIKQCLIEGCNNKR